MEFGSVLWLCCLPPSGPTTGQGREGVPRTPVASAVNDVGPVISIFSLITYVFESINHVSHGPVWRFVIVHVHNSKLFFQNFKLTVRFKLLVGYGIFGISHFRGILLHVIYLIIVVLVYTANVVGNVGVVDCYVWFMLRGCCQWGLDGYVAVYFVNSDFKSCARSPIINGVKLLWMSMSQI